MNLRNILKAIFVLFVLQPKCFFVLQAQEMRGMWANSWDEPGFKSSNSVSQLMRELRSANYNAVFAEVRKRADAYYNDSPYEPKASDIDPPDFDPLAALIEQGHDTNQGPKIEVHAWIVVYPVKRGSGSSGPNDAWTLHPDWLSQSENGDTYDGHNSQFDPGHPAVQKYIFNVAMDIISRYNIDGLHLDYMRYPKNLWGYNPVAVARFNKRFGRPGKPKPNDPDWCQFRRDQITDLLRKIYLSAKDLKPNVTISVATVAWTPGVKDEKDWVHSATYASVFQDWRSWMEEGILDLHIPMLFYKQTVPRYALDFDNWSAFAKDHAYSRQVALGVGTYRNTISNSIVQLRKAYTPTSAGNRAIGICDLGYSALTSEKVLRANFFNALTKSTTNDLHVKPIFADAALVPTMPWKTRPTKGNLKGFVYGDGPTNELDRAKLVLSGPIQRTMFSDATGFYGTIDLPPGEYTLVTSFPNYLQQTNRINVVIGKVTTMNVNLKEMDTQK